MDFSEITDLGDLMDDEEIDVLKSGSSSRLEKQKDNIRESFIDSSHEELGEIVVQLFEHSSKILESSDMTGLNWYKLADKGSIIPSIEKMIDLLEYMGEHESDKFDYFQRPAILALSDAINIADILRSAVAWDIIRKDNRPDVDELIPSELKDNITYDLMERNMIESTGYQKERGPGTSRLHYGKCERDCTVCPIAITMTLTPDTTILAEKYGCSMYTSRLILVSDPVFSALSVGILFNIQAYSTLMTNQELFLPLIFSDYYFDQRIKAIKTFMDQFPPMTEDRLSTTAIVASAEGGRSSLSKVLSKTPWPFLRRSL